MRVVRCFLAGFVVLGWAVSCSSPLENPASSEPNATLNRSVRSGLDTNATGLLQYLNDNLVSHKTLMGIANLTWNQSATPDMVTRVFNASGRYPALQGFDFMDAVDRAGTHSNADNQRELAKAWFLSNPKLAGKNGVVSMYWHWRDPSRKTDNFYKYNYQNNVSQGVDSSMHIPVDGSGNFDPTTTIGKQIKADLDFVGSELLVLKNAGVPVLWRPLHEAAGGWFWWGQDGAVQYKALWNYMRKQFDAKGLTNLIWVWNGQDAAWYPGDSSVDVAAWDCYDNNHTNQSSLYSTLSGAMANNPSKLLALSEVGAMPDPSTYSANNTWWSWFMVWNDSTTSGNSYNSNDFWSGTSWNDAATKTNYLANSSVITLDRLPSLNPYGSPSSTVLFDFENGSTQGWAGTGHSGGPWSVTDWSANGASSLKADLIQAANKVVRLALTTPLNATGSSTLKVVVRNAAWGNKGSGMTARFYLKSGSSWTWKDSGWVTIGSSTAGNALTVPLSGVAVNDIREIGVEFVCAGNSSGSTSVYLDAVRKQ